ncbi:MAG: helix-turn-helix transcriptional regulator [Thermoanaerobaculia bacterium]
MTDDREFLRAFGERVRGERAQRGMSRRLLASHAGISERYIAQLESGKGNVSILILRQIAAALGLPLTRLMEPEEAPRLSRAHRIALIGLRGAGKSTLGAALSGELAIPFFELDGEIERRSGTTLGSIFDLYGQQAYRRYETEALRELLGAHPRFIVAAGGSIVSEAATYELLLRHCFTVWVRTSPEEHMSRVLAQGDKRPMAGSGRAMDDLRRILQERTPLYRRADLAVDTTAATVAESTREIARHAGALSAL